MQATASSDPLCSFRRCGWQALRNVIPHATIARIRDFLHSELERELQRYADLNFFEANSGDYILKLLDQPATNPGLKNFLIGYFPLDTRFSPVLTSIVQEAHELLQFLKDALACEQLNMHLPPMARFVLPGNYNAGVPAHQDMVYNRHMQNFVTAWIPLVPIDEQCGGVMFYDSGDIRHELPLTKPNPSGWQRGIDTEGMECTPSVPMQPGDVLLFEPWVVHQSMLNNSARIRLSMDLRFFPSDITSEKHFLDIATMTVVAPEQGTS